MRRPLSSLILLLALSATSLPASDAPRDAAAIAARAFDVMAGPAWESARYIEFSFAAERGGKVVATSPQRWDRYTGDYRVSGTNREGKNFLVVMNINTRKGRAWLDGAEVADASELLTTGYRRFINDTYWLLMPLKMRDPGVKLEFVESKTNACGATHDILKLSFDQGVGLTSGDQYWAWVNRDSGLVDYWEMLLQGSKDSTRDRSILRNYERIGGLLLSTVREFEKTEGPRTRILLQNVKILSSVPSGAFIVP